MALRMITDFKTCEDCNGPCKLLNPPSRPQSAEWYCDKCHRSYSAIEEDGPVELTSGPSPRKRTTRIA